MSRGKDFPHIVSLPTFNIHQDANTLHNDAPLRSIESDNLRNLSLLSSPFTDDALIFDAQNDGMRSRSDLKATPHSRGVLWNQHSRLVNKAGDRNIKQVHIPRKVAKFTNDLAHSLIETQWRHLFMFFAFAFFGSWLFFAIFYYIISVSHGDLEFDEVTGVRLGEGTQPCITEVTTFAGFFLFSIESQVTTGYGTWFPTEECPETIFLLTIQLVLGVIIDGACCGVFYVKFIRPPKYSCFKFSRKAVVCQRDSKLCLLFRIADFKQDHAIDTKIRAFLFEERVSLEGERMGKCQQRLKLEKNGRVFLIWPQTVCHFIDNSSPFYDVSAKDLLEMRFEIVISMTGMSKHTGQMTQARTSYLSREILWGYRFTNIFKYDSENETHVVQMDKLDELEQIDTALCSAKRFDEILQRVGNISERDTMNSCSYVNQLAENEQHEDDSDDDNCGIHMNDKSHADMPRAHTTAAEALKIQNSKRNWSEQN